MFTFSSPEFGKCMFQFNLTGKEKSAPDDVPLAGTSTPPPTPEHVKAEYGANLVLQEEVMDY